MAATLSMPTKPTMDAALVYGDERHLRRNRTSEHLRSLGVDLKKSYRASTVSIARGLDFSNVRVVLVIAEQIEDSAAAAVREQAKRAGCACFGLAHQRSDATWQRLREWLADHGIEPRPEGAAAPAPASVPAKTLTPVPPPAPDPVKIAPSSTAQQIARSIEETEEIARLALEESATLRSDLAAAREESRRLGEELSRIKASAAAQSRAALAQELTRKEAECADLTRTLAETERAMTDRLDAAETLRKREAGDAREAIARARAERDNALAALAELRAQPPAQAAAAPEDGTIMRKLRLIVDAADAEVLEPAEAIAKIAKIVRT